MNIDGIIVQLRALAPIFSGNVAGAAAYANGVDDQAWLPLPAAYVIPLDEVADRNTDQTGLQQIVTERIGVIVVLDNSVDPADRRGQASAQQFRQLRAAIFRALLNWRPDFDPANPSTNIESRGLSYGGAEILGFDRARLMIQYNFDLEVTITDEDGWQLTGVPLQQIDISLQQEQPATPAVPTPIPVQVTVVTPPPAS